MPQLGARAVQSDPDLASALTVWTFGASYFACFLFLIGKAQVTILRIKYINVHKVHRVVPGM